MIKNILMMVCLLILPINSFVERSSFAAVTDHHPNLDDSILSTRGTKVLKILSVLDNRIADPSLLEKAKNKIFSLSDRQIHLIASLSDQVMKERNSIGGDITFLLLTALIICL
jgi:hypothetical protein